MVQEENAVNDGADEQMLGVEDNEKLAQKREEVKFIKGDQQNGDAKIDIGNATNGKAFTGMTKEELMKFTNDPFWVRLRWIFFIAFWAIWVGMLVGAILIIIGAPKCAAPEPIPWYKQGLLAKFESWDAPADDIEASKNIHATGAIYELPVNWTYSVKDPSIEEKIKKLVSSYKDSGVDVILDVTPNYVNNNSQLMQDALANKTKRSAFIWIESPDKPNNWRSINDEDAWTLIEPGNYVLSQFGHDSYDLRMNDTIVKEAFSGVLKHLIELGVKGIRLKNTKFFQLATNLANESAATNNDPKYVHDQYGFWTHEQTTFRDGLGDVLSEYRAVVRNISHDSFVSVAEDIIRPDVYRDSDGFYGIDMPMYGRFEQQLNTVDGSKELEDELLKVRQEAGNDVWLQWNLSNLTHKEEGSPSASLLFMSLISGVPVIPIDSIAFRNISKTIYKQIETLRLSPSFMHGDFHLYNSSGLLAYTRIKSGNPGYLVIFNPSGEVQQGNFTNSLLPDKMTVAAISANYNITDITIKSKVETKSLIVSPYSTIILTYVPVKTG